MMVDRMQFIETLSTAYIWITLFSLYSVRWQYQLDFWVMLWLLHLIPWSAVQVIFSMGDEYVPEYVDKKALVDR